MQHSDSHIRRQGLPDTPEHWLSQAVAFSRDVITDQLSVLSDYKLRFALDFHDLRHLIRPWAADDLSDDVTSLESMFAAAYVTYEMQQKPHLRRTLLLPEYLQEYVEHAAFVSANGLYGDWLAMDKCRRSLEERYALIREAAAMPETDRDAFLAEHQNDLLDLLAAEFHTLVRLALSSASSTPMSSARLAHWDLIDSFEDPADFETDWSDVGSGPQFDCIYAALNEFVQDVLRRNPDAFSSEDKETVDRRCRRDACALQRVIQLNRKYILRSQKERIYFLSSSRRFWGAYRNEANQTFRQLCSLEVPSGVQTDPTCGGAPNCVLRHPFCFVLFLVYWPGRQIPRLEDARRTLVKRLRSLESRAHLYRPMVTESAPEFRGSNTPVGNVATAYKAVGEALKRWKNVALAAMGSDLLPPSLRGTNIASAAISVVSLLRDAPYERFADTILTEKDRRYELLTKAFYALIKFYIEQRVNAAFVGQKIGQLHAFPYLLRFQDPRILSQIARLREIRSALVPVASAVNTEAVESVKGTLLRLVTLIGPPSEPDQECREAALLAGSLLLLFDKFREARECALIGPWPSDGSWRTEFHYLKLLIDFRRVMTEPPEDAAELLHVIDRIPHRLVERDHRIRERVLVLEACYLRRTTSLDLDRRVEALIAAYKLLATECESGRSIGLCASSRSDASLAEELRVKVWNNYAFTLLEFGQRLNREVWLVEAYTIALEHLEPQLQEAPTEIKHTFARALHYYAVLKKAGTAEAARLLKTALWWYEICEQEISLLEIPGSARSEEVLADRRRLLEELKEEFPASSAGHDQAPELGEGAPKDG